MNSTGLFGRYSWIQPVYLEETVEFIHFFQIDWCKTANAARNWTYSAPQTDATTFAFSCILFFFYGCCAPEALYPLELPWGAAVEVLHPPVRSWSTVEVVNKTTTTKKYLFLLRTLHKKPPNLTMSKCWPKIRCTKQKMFLTLAVHCFLTVRLITIIICCIQNQFIVHKDNMFS